MHEKLLSYLLNAGLLTRLQAERIREEYATGRRSFRELLVECGFLSEEQLAEAFSAVTGIPTVHLYEHTVPAELLRLVRPELLRSHLVLPFAVDPTDERLLYVALCDPMNIRGRDIVAAAAKCRVKLFLTTAADILLAIDRCYGTAEMREAAEQYAPSVDAPSSEEASMRVDVNASPVVMLVTALVEQAVRRRASDIHIEPMGDRVRVRFRVDGVLAQAAAYDPRLLSAIVARVKIISGMDISEKRRPQDGRFSVMVDRVEYDVRVSTLPTVYGEKCVLRLAMKRALHRGKRSLGFFDDDLQKFERVLHRPNGLVLVTGPTGSGKSTTLYTALHELNRDAVNIVTVEDPVEADLEGVNQVQVNPKAELTFASALRSILRQDPDVIMIGEIRDSETASIAVQASITGHLVVSTLHTNDAASSVTRLLDMGVESYLIADATVGIIAQRLVRRLCPCCRRVRALLPDEAEYLGLPESVGTAVYEAVGCPRCGETGYYGRIGVYEIMEVTPTLRALIADRASTAELRRQALCEGMRPLYESAARLVLDGTTSLGELHRVGIAPADALSPDSADPFAALPAPR